MYSTLDEKSISLWNLDINWSNESILYFNLQPQSRFKTLYSKFSKDFCYITLSNLLHNSMYYENEEWIKLNNEMNEGR
jgi:hypothetical protein